MIEADDKLSDDGTLKNTVILITWVTKNDDKLFLEESLVA